MPSSRAICDVNMPMLTADAQIRYLIQWFHEWSDLQRQDFLPVMAEKYANKVYMNGIVNSISNVNCRDKPMSLFECRVTLGIFECFWVVSEGSCCRSSCSRSGTRSGTPKIGRISWNRWRTSIRSLRRSWTRNCKTGLLITTRKRTGTRFWRIKTMVGEFLDYFLFKVKTRVSNGLQRSVSVNRQKANKIFSFFV